LKSPQAAEALQPEMSTPPQYEEMEFGQFLHQGNLIDGAWVLQEDFKLVLRRPIETARVIGTSPASGLQ
jgi:hypothetical protein